MDYSFIHDPEDEENDRDLDFDFDDPIIKGDEPEIGLNRL